MREKMSTILQEIENIKSHMVAEDSNIDSIEMSTRRKNEKLKKQVQVLTNSVEELQHTMNKELELNNQHLNEQLDNVGYNYKLSLDRLEKRMEGIEGRVSAHGTTSQPDMSADATLVWLRPPRSLHAHPPDHSDQLSDAQPDATTPRSALVEDSRTKNSRPPVSSRSMPEPLASALITVAATSLPSPSS